MTIPPEINSLVESLNQQLDEIEYEAAKGQNLARMILDKFPNNASLVQFFATFSNALLFVEVERRRIKSILENISLLDTVTDADIKELGEDLSAEMGRILETKSMIVNLKQRLESLL
ncbi:MAG: restriction endonuclease subunit S [Cyanobacteria bacterium J06621_8]